LALARNAAGIAPVGRLVSDRLAVIEFSPLFAIGCVETLFFAQNGVGVGVPLRAF
jgi:hypothetical protein